MKTLSIAFVCLCLFTSVCRSQTNSIVTTNSSPRAEAVAILKLRIQCVTAYTNSFFKGSSGKPMFSSQRYFSKIRQINTTDCPNDFRLAWSDYLFAFQQRLATKGSIAGEVEVLFGMPAKGASDIQKSNDKISDAKNKEAEALHQCERLAIQYGAE